MIEIGKNLYFTMLNEAYQGNVQDLICGIVFMIKSWGMVQICFSISLSFLSGETIHAMSLIYLTSLYGIYEVTPTVNFLFSCYLLLSLFFFFSFPFLFPLFSKDREIVRCLFKADYFAGKSWFVGLYVWISCVYVGTSFDRCKTDFSLNLVYYYITVRVSWHKSFSDVHFTLAVLIPLNISLLTHEILVLLKEFHTLLKDLLDVI